MSIITEAIGVVCQGQDARLSPQSLSVLRLARSLTSGPVIVILSETMLESQDYPLIAKNGADYIYQLGHGNELDAAMLVSAVTQIQKDHDVVAVLGESALSLTQAFAGAAALLRSAVSSQIAQLEVKNNELLATKSALSGSWECLYSFKRGRKPAFITLTSGITAPEPEEENSEVTVLKLDPPSPVIRVAEKEILEYSSQSDLQSASVVVCVGAGSSDCIESVTELANITGAALGATRPVCDEQILPRKLQIGQTGRSVYPRLYLGLGVSGAVHHACAITGSQKIVAVCDDPDAPIMSACDLGIIGQVEDLFDSLIDKVREV